jgi:tRNA-splicing ligase RtcB
MEWEKQVNLNNITIKSWCRRVEEGAMAQAMNCANHPKTVLHVALMPDCHRGVGVPIGTVWALKDAIVPMAVGVDIGCGMMAVQTNYPAAELSGEDVKAILEIIYQRVPVGFARHAEPQGSVVINHAPNNPVVLEHLDRARYQVGTLGGGNHFIELQRGDDGFLWLMVHSGSRNFGFQIAKHFHLVAQEFCLQHKIFLPDKDLAYLPSDSNAGKMYIEAMEYAVAYAEENRSHIMTEVFDVITDVLSHHNFKYTEEIDISHNFAQQESHFNQLIWVHRKGATPAHTNQKGIIPGSMGTPSYIVRGLGNRDAFRSCAHGAGRKMSRTLASKALSETECNAAMKGVVFSGWGKDRKGRIDLGEAPQAYKDIDMVMASQQDLVESVVKLEPVGAVKG